MKHLYWIMPCLILSGCLSEEVPETHHEAAIITGNQFNPFYSPESRQILAHELPDGAKASFFSTGGIEARNEALTYSRPVWTHHLKWNESQSEADINVYYPEFPHPTSGFYEPDGELKDYLNCHQTAAYQSNITLSFQHMFSLLSLEVNKRINRTVSSITVTPSLCITDIDPFHRDITYDREKNGPAYTLPMNKSGNYQLIIPPAPNMGITLDITYRNNSQKTFHIKPRDYQPNTRYRCRLTAQNQEAGIYNAEDFIAFTHLYNGEEYEDRTLDEFGVTKDNVTTYYLHHDIDFTAEESARIQDIGYFNFSMKGIGFKDVFDGQGHTLSNLNLNIYVSKRMNNKYCVGLFNWVTPTGRIENLRIAGAQLNGAKVYYPSVCGTLIGYNEGTVNNCQVTNIRFNPTTEEHLGGIVGFNCGYLTNCGAESVTFNKASKRDNTRAGGLAAINKQSIINCYSGLCNFTGTTGGGGIISKLNQGEITNCYVYQSKYKSKKLYADIAYTTINGHIKYCYYHRNITSQNNEKLKISNTLPYNDNTLLVNKGGGYTEPLINILNRWVTQIGNKEFPSFRFSQWITGSKPPVVLQQLKD